MASILIIDDDRVFCDVLSRSMSLIGHNATFSLTLQEGLREVRSRSYDIVLLDVQLPDGNGLKAIENIRKISKPPEVIIITGFGDPGGAELAIKWGAWDYVEKPASTVGITLPVLRALEYRKEKLAKKRTTLLNRNGVIGESPALANCLDLLAQAARGDVSALITGETGTGKELFARILHENSPRAAGPFVVVDCTSLPESLVESLLFGHERGAFTGADRKRTGLIKEADGGTLFLDEVGELSLPLQKSFLRVIQEHRCRPVGSKTEETSDFRLISATNRNLDLMVESAAFRSDLLFRLRSLTIELPPLRERPEDIKDIAMHHMAECCEKARIMMKGCSPDFFDALQSYPWPGNIRELFNALENAIAVAGSESILYPNHLPLAIRAAMARSSVEKNIDDTKPEVESAPQDETHSQEHLPDFKMYREKLLESGEKKYFTQVVSLSGGDIKEACRIAGLSKSRLYYFLQKHGLSLN